MLLMMLRTLMLLMMLLRTLLLLMILLRTLLTMLMLMMLLRLLLRRKRDLKPYIWTPPAAPEHPVLWPPYRCCHRIHCGCCCCCCCCC